jgi:nucleoside phosphorylase
MINYKYGIVCAMREESEKIIKALALSELYGTLFPTHSNENIVLIESQIGKVASTVATTHLINAYNPDSIINIGIAGSANTRYKFPNTYIISSVSQCDVFMPFEQYQEDMYQEINCFVPIPVKATSIQTATLATGDKFVEDVTNIDEDLVDMEGFAVAYVAKKYNKQVILIKSVSDNVDNVAQDIMFDNLNTAMDTSISVLKEII